MKMKEVKENLNQWTDTACGWFGRFNIAETSILSEITDIQVNSIPIKIPAGVSVDKEKIILKFMQKGKRTRIPNTFLEKTKVENHSPTC